ncbi:MAG: hypothetical protein HPY76_04505, partial [Anaerolineae bacterium]|nr:hypothetical protein [Anaerolineae bacterium]
GAAYSMHARLHMLAGFQVIMTELGLRRLVAVYLDIAQCDQVVRPAYDQMKSDLLAGVFCQLFVFRVADLAPCPAVLDELSSLRSQVPAFEILAFDTVKQTVQRFDDEQANRVHLE